MIVDVDRTIRKALEAKSEPITREVLQQVASGDALIEIWHEIGEIMASGGRDASEGKGDVPLPAPPEALGAMNSSQCRCTTSAPRS